MKHMFSNRPPLVAGMWITIGVTLFGLGAAALRPKAFAKVSYYSQALIAQQTNCRTVATDPQPPLNIRTRPDAQSSGNIIGTAANGTTLQVVETQADWLRITQPISGWVHQSLTATSCSNAQGEIASIRTAKPAASPSQQIIHSAHDRFAAGHLQAALSLLQSIPPSDTTYEQAQHTYRIMSQQWNQGHVAYQSAQQAVKKKQWLNVLTHVQALPDVTYWRAKMAPLVKQAIRQQSNLD